MDANTNVVFGASGVVGKAVVRLLSKNGATVVAVSRTGKIEALDGLPGVTFKAADALNEEQVVDVCQGASSIYCSIGLKYDSAVWERDFPKIVESMLQAAEKTGAVMVWADNMYMFGPEAARAGRVLKESDTEFTVEGRKPALRARMDRQMLEAASSGRCKVAIVRASDFYGPEVVQAALGDDFFKPLLKGSKVMLLGTPMTQHTFTYVPDLAKALVAVAGKPSAWGRAWHCPNAEASSIVGIMDKVAGMSGGKAPPKYTVLKGLFARLLGLFIPALVELREMSFLYDYDFLIDHSDFSAKFRELALPTPMEDGLKATVDWYTSQEAK